MFPDGTAWCARRKAFQQVLPLPGLGRILVQRVTPLLGVRRMFFQRVPPGITARPHRVELSRSPCSIREKSKKVGVPAKSWFSTMSLSPSPTAGSLVPGDGILRKRALRERNWLEESENRLCASSEPWDPLKIASERAPGPISPPKSLLTVDRPSWCWRKSALI